MFKIELYSFFNIKHKNTNIRYDSEYYQFEKKNIYTQLEQNFILKKIIIIFYL